MGAVVLFHWLRDDDSPAIGIQPPGPVAAFTDSSVGVLARAPLVRAAWVSLAAGAALLAPHRVHGQITGVVLDSLSQQALGSVGVLVTRPSDSTPVCSILTHADGAFRCPATVGDFVVSIRHVGYVPVQFEATSSSGDSVRSRIALVRLPTTLDTVRTSAPNDTAYRGLFSVTPGREQFLHHMELEKGHFVTGIDILRSGMTLSQYLLARFADTLKVIDLPHGAVVPIMHRPVPDDDHGCLYIRIDLVSACPKRSESWGLPTTSMSCFRPTRCAASSCTSPM